MARFKSLADQADSQEAICDYMYYREENKYMHRARVLISSCGKNQYNRILNIIPEISTNDAHVYIEGDAQFERDYYLEYSNKFQEFSFISGTLLIKARDCKLRSNGMPVPLLRNGYSIFNGTKYR